MNTEQPGRQDQRTVAVENAGFKRAYHFLFFGLLLDCVYRYKVRNEDIADLLALAGASVAVITVYLIRHKTAARSWKELLFAYVVPPIPLADLPALLICIAAGSLGCQSG